MTRRGKPTMIPRLLGDSRRNRMSLHKSLKIKDQLARARNVLSRTERVAAMKEKGTFQEGDSVFGLPKLRVKIRKRKKKKEAPEEAKEGEAAAEGEASKEGEAKAKT